MLKQNARPLPISLNPRSSLDSSYYGLADAVLKDLKNCSRRLHTALGAFRDEYQVLERLYYKGKNQHHIALFWRRVVEIRRFCRRLDDIRVDHALDSLRGSFFNVEDARSNPKMMRGSWTHFPEVALVELVLQRFCLCSALLEKMQGKLLDSYRSFNIAMRSGAFLQLILTLVAIASRMGAICEELQEILQATRDITQRIPEILLAPRNTLSPPIIKVVEDEAMTLDSLTSQSEIVEPSMLDVLTTPVPTGPARITVERNAKETEVALKVKKATNDTEQSRTRRHLKPRDEIDDIFGF